MNKEHVSDFKERALYRSFAAENRALQFSFAHTGAIIRGTDEASEYEDIVREEVKRIERTANVVASVTVEDFQVHAVFLLGHDADQKLVERLLEDMQYRIFERATDDSE